MKSLKTTYNRFGVTVLVMLLCGCLWAQTPGVSFFEDFSDGDPADGSPVNWVPSAGPDPGTNGYTFTPEGLDVLGATAAARDGSYHMYGDVSITVQIKRISDHTNNEWVSGFTCRWTDGATGGYWIEVRPPNRFFFGHRDRYILRSAALPFNVDEQELMIRVDAIGDHLKAWCWPVSESMPEMPQISLVDDVAPGGVISLYASSWGGQAIFRSVEVVVPAIDPILDFNGNGQVDIKDLVKMIDCWGQYESSVDLDGDGMVDVNDLEILMNCWQQDVNDPTLLAHWALDEAEGMIAYDSAGTHDGVITGDPIWHPDEGQVNGAVLLDGMNDYVSAPSVLDPAGSVFSVFVWIKRGMPGQTIISQKDGTDWLLTDTHGSLMTRLAGTGGRGDGEPLVSDTNVTDGLWHRIGLVWDGSYRSLYVDDELVATDAAPQNNFPSSQGGLIIGAADDVQSGTFWSGLIDDVRIYDRVVVP